MLVALPTHHQYFCLRVILQRNPLTVIISGMGSQAKPEMKAAMKTNLDKQRTTNMIEFLENFIPIQNIRRPLGWRRTLRNIFGSSPLQNVRRRRSHLFVIRNHSPTQLFLIRHLISPLKIKIEIIRENFKKFSDF